MTLAGFLRRLGVGLAMACVVSACGLLDSGPPAELAETNPGGTTDGTADAGLPADGFVLDFEAAPPGGADFELQLGGGEIVISDGDRRLAAYLSTYHGENAKILENLSSGVRLANLTSFLTSIADAYLTMEATEVPLEASEVHPLILDHLAAMEAHYTTNPAGDSSQVDAMEIRIIQLTAPMEIRLLSLSTDPFVTYLFDVAEIESAPIPTIYVDGPLAQRQAQVAEALRILRDVAPRFAEIDPPPAARAIHNRRLKALTAAEAFYVSFEQFNAGAMTANEDAAFRQSVRGELADNTSFAASNSRALAKALQTLV